MPDKETPWTPPDYNELLGKQGYTVKDCQQDRSEGAKNFKAMNPLEQALVSRAAMADSRENSKSVRIMIRSFTLFIVLGWATWSLLPSITQWLSIIYATHQ